nr:unnamed protein product [Callosobruchus analis]
MESNTCSTDDSARYDKHLHFTMDYDSGYMSHNPESNLGSPLENLSESTHISKPVFLSEDALLERPVIAKSDLSFQIDNENYEETRQLFFNISDDETVLSASVSSREDNCNALKSSDSSRSNKSAEIPIAAPIVVEAKAVETENVSTAFNNITNTLVTADPKKKLVLVLSKCDKENMYSVKRKYKSMTPESDKHTDSSFDRSMGNNNETDTSMSLEETLDNPIITSKSEMELRNGSECDAKDESTFTVYSDISMDISLMDQSQNECSQKNNSKIHLCNDPTISTDSISGNISIAPLTDHSVSKISICQNSTSSINGISKLSVDQQKITLPIVKCDSITNMNLVDIIKLHDGVESIASPNSTPKKRYINSLQSCMSPDLFEDEEEPVKAMVEVVHPEKQIPEEKYLHKKDYRLIQRVQGTLKGVLPPQSMTVCNISVDEILNKVESNKNCFFWNHETAINETEKHDEKLNISNESLVAGEPKSLLITGSLEDCTKKDFPHIMKGRNHGLYFNSNRLSEQLEELLTKYAQRYVGAETQSSCTVFDTVTNMSPSKRCRLVGRRWITKSPGRRLSHLARRRITFSSANLAAAGTSGAAGNRARQILVDAKRLELLSRRKSPRKTPKKTPNKSPKKKTRTPSSSAKKKLAMRFRKMTGEIENTIPGTSADVLKSSSKRALFQSPDKKKETSLFLPTTFGLATFENSPSKKLPTKRALFSSPNRRSPLKRSPFKRSPFLEKKRKRTDSEEGQPVSKMPRSMSSMSEISRPSDPETKTLLSRTKSDVEISGMMRQPLGELSAVHKKKLQWAVYEALRSQNVTPTHNQFKLFASVLARVTRRLMLNVNLGQPRPEGSTTERMLRIAKHHVISVIKGKSVEEIISEYNRLKAKTFKPQGYIGIEEFNRLESMSKENILRERIENAANSANKPVENLQTKFTPNNRVERIRKVIKFGDDDNR